MTDFYNQAAIVGNFPGNTEAWLPCFGWPGSYHKLQFGLEVDCITVDHHDDFVQEDQVEGHIHLVVFLHDQGHHSIREHVHGLDQSVGHMALEAITDAIKCAVMGVPQN